VRRCLSSRRGRGAFGGSPSWLARIGHSRLEHTGKSTTSPGHTPEAAGSARSRQPSQGGTRLSTTFVRSPARSRHPDQNCSAPAPAARPPAQHEAPRYVLPVEWIRTGRFLPLRHTNERHSRRSVCARRWRPHQRPDAGDGRAPINPEVWNLTAMTVSFAGLNRSRPCSETSRIVRCLLGRAGRLFRSPTFAPCRLRRLNTWNRTAAQCAAL